MVKRKSVSLLFCHTTYDACAGEVWTEGSFTLALLQGWGVESEVLLEQVQLNFSFHIVHNSSSV